MAIEAARGCGYRKVGGLYMVGSGLGVNCDRLPITLEICKCCGQGIKQTRGWTWVDIAGLIGGDHQEALNAKATDMDYELNSGIMCRCPQFCPLCHNVAKMGKGGLLWIGAQFYPTIEAFEAEAKAQGISRRITTVPRNFKVGETWVLLAHPRGVIKPADGNPLAAKYVPAIFRVWKPERLERIYKESDRNSDAVQADIERGITPVYVPDNDKDHQGSAYDKEEKETATEVAPPLFNANGLGGK